MNDLITDIHEPMLRRSGFEPTDPPAHFGPLWHSYTVSPDVGKGLYHLCSPTGKWSIAIHDFTMRQDCLLEMHLPEYLSITWYESISGEEFTPYRKLIPKSLRGFYSSKDGWRALIHGNVHMKCIGIEVTPEFSAHYLDREYGNEFAQVRDAFLSLDNDGDFPELRILLQNLWPKEKALHHSQLYYEGKVLEAMGIIIDYTRTDKAKAKPSAAREDIERIRTVAAYIDDHCTTPLRIEDLARIACMGTTKFKLTFKQVLGASVTQYVQVRRISLAEQLLRQSDLSIAQVAHAVGYSCASRFSELFKRETGFLPSEYRTTITQNSLNISS